MKANCPICSRVLDLKSNHDTAVLCPDCGRIFCPSDNGGCLRGTSERLSSSWLLEPGSLATLTRDLADTFDAEAGTTEEVWLEHEPDEILSLGATGSFDANAFEQTRQAEDEEFLEQSSSRQVRRNVLSESAPWYIVDDIDEYGPLTTHQVIRAAKQGRIHPGSILRNARTQKEHKAGQLPKLFPVRPRDIADDLDEFDELGRAV